MDKDIQGINEINFHADITKVLYDLFSLSEKKGEELKRYNSSRDAISKSLADKIKEEIKSINQLHNWLDELNSIRKAKKTNEDSVMIAYICDTCHQHVSVTDSQIVACIMLNKLLPSGMAGARFTCKKCNKDAGMLTGIKENVR